MKGGESMEDKLEAETVVHTHTKEENTNLQEEAKKTEASTDKYNRVERR